MILPPCGKVSNSSPPARSRWLATSPSCRQRGRTSGAGYRRFRRPPSPQRASPSRRRNPLLRHRRRCSRPRPRDPPLCRQQRRPRPRRQNRQHGRQCRCGERRRFASARRSASAAARGWLGKFFGARSSLCLDKPQHGHNVDFLEHDPEKACTRAGGCRYRFSEKACPRA